MARLTSIFIDPIYRLLLGPPASHWTGQVLPQAARADEAPGSRGLVLVADGVGGLDLCGAGLAHVMGAAKVPHSILVFPWGHGFGRWLADLTDVAHRDAMAQSIAESIARFKNDRPAEPVFVVAKSGGSGVVVKALERLDEHAVERVILLAPAVSPGYDLTLALRAVRCEMVVFWSPLDLIILGAGTRVFGTIDRVRTASAGLVGFKKPAGSPIGDSQANPYDKLRQVRWRPDMASTGYLGGHLGPDCPLFLRKYVVPLLRTNDSTGC
jgi:Serine aminopeptidase, S33